MTSIEYGPLSYIYHYLSDVIIFLTTFFYLFLPAQPDNARLTVDEVTTSSTVLSFEIENKTNRILGKPSTILIEKNVNGSWEKADINGYRQEDYYTVVPGNSVSDSIGLILTDGYNGFDKGEYRITVFYKVGTAVSVTEGKASAVFTVDS